MFATPDARPRAVVIEDDPEVAELISAILSQAGFDTVVAVDGPSGVEAVRTHEPTITTVDVGLPGLDGLAVTRRIRDFSSTYVVMVTGYAGEDDILGGFAAGADDYVTKPIRPREVRSRLLAVLRRPIHRFPIPMAEPPQVPAHLGPPDGVLFDGEWVEFRGIRLHPASGELTVSEAPVAISRLELDLLELMLYAGTRPRSTTHLALSVRGESYAADSTVRESDREVVDAAMESLLHSLGDDPAHPLWIESVGDGYRLVPALAQVAAS
jgi:two-component system, OmpR family, response regulator